MVEGSEAQTSWLTFLRPPSNYMQRPDLNWRQVQIPPHPTASHLPDHWDLLWHLLHIQIPRPHPRSRESAFPWPRSPRRFLRPNTVGKLFTTHPSSGQSHCAPAESHGRVPLWGLLRDVPAAGAHQEALARARDDLFECCRHSGTLHWWRWVAEALGRYTH